MKNYDIAVIGLGYVGLANAIALSNHCTVTAYDNDEEKIKVLKKRQLYIQEKELINAFTENSGLLDISEDFIKLCHSSDSFLIALPTNWDDETGKFDTAIIETTIKKVLDLNPAAHFIIRSTIPVGFVGKLEREYSTKKFHYAPEFLREGSSYYDMTHPSRVVIGTENIQEITGFVAALQAVSNYGNAPIIICSPLEAEIIKLASNTYLATRVAFFNEIDNLCIQKKISAKRVIKGMSLDPRIGEIYNNPSFGYGGYCLPKDTQQLGQNFGDVPCHVITATVHSNRARKAFIVNEILETGADIIGFYRINMKYGSDNFRESASIEIIRKLVLNNKKVLVYEPLLTENTFHGAERIKKFTEFGRKANLVVANRQDDELELFKDKIFTRDIYRTS